ncbi:unnamed protein product [Rhizophagus irregularis]|nr:unnamed protein product [Rhizophagus irregularis]
MVIFERITIPIRIVLKPRIWKLKCQRSLIKFLDHKYKIILYPTVNFPISAEVTVTITGIVYTSDLKDLRAALKRLKDKHLLISRQYRHKTRKKKKKLKIAKWTGRKSKFEIAIFVVVVIITADVFFIRKSEFNICANEDSLTDPLDQKCSLMFEKSAIIGGKNSVISLKLNPDNKVTTGNVAAVVAEWKDYYKIGHKLEDGRLEILICDKAAIELNFCSESQENNFIVPINETTSIVTHFFNLKSKDTYTFNYPINKTAFYCVATSPVNNDDTQYFVTIDWQNPYGELPASEYPKLPFYGALSLIYLVIGIVWMTLSIIHRHDILPVQNYISGVILFLMLEMAFNWGYWENYNSYGHSCSNIPYYCGRYSQCWKKFYFIFMLLIVCMGYGVVKPTLGSTMNKCRALAATHFLFGIIYSAGTMLLDPENANPLIFLVIFPLALTMTAFYIWTLQSITNTLQTLEILAVLGVFFFINMINYLRREDPDWIPTYWRWRWFLLDGWLNILYLIVFCVILIIWRPTRNNKRFAMSEELTQEDPYELENTLRAAENMGSQSSHEVTSQRVNIEENQDHIEQEISKLN